jgi:carbon storage regulator
MQSLQTRSYVMLVLNVNIGKSLIINDTTKVQVLNVEGSQVKIGIEAPRDVSVYREEIYRKIREQQKAT